MKHWSGDWRHMAEEYDFKLNCKYAKSFIPLRLKPVVLYVG